MKILLTTICLLAGAGFASRACADSLADKLPEEMRVGLWVDDLTAAQKDANQNEFYRWLSDDKKGVGGSNRAVERTMRRIPMSAADPLQVIWSSVLPNIDKILEDSIEGASEVFDFKAKDIVKTFTGPFALYSTMFDLYKDGKNDITEWDVILEASYKPDEKPKVDQFLEKCLKKVPADAQKKEVDYFGVKVKHIEYYLEEKDSSGLSEETAIFIEYGWVDDYFLLSEGRGEPLKKAIRALKSPGDEAKPLAKTQGFRYAQSALGSDAGKFHFYLDVEHCVKELKDIDEKQTYDWLKAAGLATGGPLMANCQLDQTGANLRLALVSEDVDPSGIFDVVAKSPENKLRNLPLIPPDATSFATFSLSGPELLRQYRGTAKTGKGGISFADAMITNAKALFGVDLENDLVAQFEGEAIVYVREIEGGASGGIFLPYNGGLQTANAVNTLVRNLSSEQTRVLDLDETESDGIVVWESKETVTGQSAGLYFAATPQGLVQGSSGSELRDEMRRVSGDAAAVNDETGKSLQAIPREGLRAVVFTPAKSIADGWERAAQQATDSEKHDRRDAFPSREEIGRMIGDTWWALNNRPHGFLFSFTIEQPPNAN